MMDMRVRGVLIYECKDCKVFFSVSFLPEVSCPGCKSNNVENLGDGCTYYNENQIIKEPHVKEVPSKEESAIYVENGDEILTAQQISGILGISRRVVYEIMEQRDFPLLRIGRYKRVTKRNFHEWLHQKRL
ncbi:helix-turn-helix domain-containing protein [Metabacillus fastidiosus]|uniref:helix-turn-helix domain-containing protein n=1 Tax=Metabacillus fastidiosus TaxID=1458 RepID=UPI002E1C8874|nr:helix-turn-helix domain-containing protein [Metabacillus fastidiosus]